MCQVAPSHDNSERRKFPRKWDLGAVGRVIESGEGWWEGCLVVLCTFPEDNDEVGAVARKSRNGGNFSGSGKSVKGAIKGMRRGVTSPQCTPVILTQSWLVDKVPGHGQDVLALSLPCRHRHFEVLFLQ